MATQNLTVTPTATNLVAELALTDGARYTVHNIGDAPVWWAAAALDPGAGGAWDRLDSDPEDGETVLNITVGGPVWVRVLTRTSTLAVTEAQS